MIEDKPEEKKSSNTKLKIFAILFTLFFIVVLIVIKWRVPAFPLIWVIVIGAFILIGGALAFFAGSIVKKLKEKEGVIKNLTLLPKPASLDSLLDMADQALTNKYSMNHTTGCLTFWFETLPKSKNNIFVYKTKALYNENMEKGFIYILINAHYPLDKRDILVDPTDYELRKKIHSLGTEVEEEPQEEVTTITNPTLGVQTVTKKPVVKKTDHEKEAEKKEDLE